MCPLAPGARHTDAGHPHSSAAQHREEKNLPGSAFLESTKDVLGDAGLAPWCAQLGSIWEDRTRD